MLRATSGVARFRHLSKETAVQESDQGSWTPGGIAVHAPSATRARRAAELRLFFLDILNRDNIRRTRFVRCTKRLRERSGVG